MDYYADKAKREIERRLERAEALAEAWRAIERYKTKDGKDFKNLAQNFTKGAIRPKTYSPNEKEMSVSIRSEKGHYFDDSFSISNTVYARTEEAERYKAEGRLIERGQFLHPYVNMTPDEIEQAIHERAGYHDKTAKDLTSLLNNFTEVAKHIVDIRKEGEAYIAKQPSEAYYVLRNVLRGEWSN